MSKDMQTYLFNDTHMVDPDLRDAVQNPRDYPLVCVRKGRDYFEYGNFSLDATLAPETFRLKSYLGKGTFARCYASVLTSSPGDKPKLCIKVLKRTKERHFVKLRRELSVLTKMQDCPGTIPYHGLIKDPDCKLWRSIPDELEKVELQDEEMMNNLRQQSLARHRVALVFNVVNDTLWRTALETMSNDTLAYLMFQVLVTLDCAHSKGIMHRDIKPPNCLLDLENERVVVIDWGQAEFFVPYYKHNVQVGGRSFKAPELVYGGNVVRGLHDYAVDVWAFGVMMASMVFFGGSKNLFWADDREGVIESISELLGTEDLVRYLRERPYIDMSECCHDLCSEEITRRDEPFVQSELVNHHIGELKKKGHYHDIWATRQTPDALDLINQVLRYNPRERPTCREMITTHPYFNDARARLNREHAIVFDTTNATSKINDAAIEQTRSVFVLERTQF